MIQLTEGLKVIYKDLIGIVTFVDTHSISIMIREFPKEPVRNVKIVVYRGEWKNIELFTEDDK